MSPVPLKHILEQGPMLRALVGTAIDEQRSALLRAIGAARGPRSSERPATPGPWIDAEARAPSPELVRAFVAFSRGDQASYRGVLPPHLFPQWTLATASRALADVPYPLTRIVNAGVRLDFRAPLPAGEPLRVRARLDSIDERRSALLRATDERPTSALMVTRIETGPAGAPDALCAELRTYVPLAKRAQGASPHSEKRPDPPRVAADARELAFLRVRADAGLDFAKLTGDFNPIHYVPAYARAAGFRAPILHGFGELALAMSALVKGLLSGDASRLRVVDVRFTRPCVLPCALGIYVTDVGELFVGDAPGGAAYLAGRFEVAPPGSSSGDPA